MPKPKKKAVKKSPVAPKPGQSQLKSIQDLMRRRQYAEAGRAALQAMGRFPNNPDFPEIAAEALIEAKSDRAALLPVRRLLEMKPNDMRALYLASVVYASNTMLAHAIRCFRRMVEINPEHSTVERLRAMVERGDEYLKSMSESLEASFEETEEGSFLLEEANYSRSGEGDLERAIGYLRDAANVLPKSVPVKTYLAELLFLTGDLDGSEKAARQALELQSDDVDASLRRMLIARSRYDDDALRSAYEPVKESQPESQEERLQLIRAHGLAGEHEKAYEFAQKVATSEEGAPATAYGLLGAAAANAGRIQEAKGFYRLAARTGWMGLERDSLEGELPGPNIATAYPYLHRSELIQTGVLQQVLAPIQESLQGGQQIPKVAANDHLQKYPQIVWIGEKLLKEEDTAAGLALLLSLGSEKAVEIAYSVAEGEDSTWYARLMAATALMDHGLWKEGETLKLPRDGRTFEVTPEEVRNLFAEGQLDPNIAEQIEKSNQLYGKEPQQAIIILQGLIEANPDLAPAYHNLGLFVESREETERYLRKSIELDSNYTLARTSLAAFLSTEDRVEEAEELVASIPEDRLLKPNEYISMLYARAHIARAKKETDEAITLIKKAIRENIFFSPAYDLLERLREEKGGTADLALPQGSSR